MYLKIRNDNYLHEDHDGQHKIAAISLLIFVLHLLTERLAMLLADNQQDL